MILFGFFLLPVQASLPQRIVSTPYNCIFTNIPMCSAHRVATHTETEFLVLQQACFLDYLTSVTTTDLQSWTVLTIAWCLGRTSYLSSSKINLVTVFSFLAHKSPWTQEIHLSTYDLIFTATVRYLFILRQGSQYDAWRFAHFLEVMLSNVLGTCLHAYSKVPTLFRYLLASRGTTLSVDIQAPRPPCCPPHTFPVTTHGSLEPTVRLLLLDLPLPGCLRWCVLPAWGYTLFTPRINL